MIRLNNLHPYKTDDDIFNILNGILRDIDLSKTVSGMLICTTDSVRYNSCLSEYIYYLEHIENQLEYNKWIDILIERHIMNLIVEMNHKNTIIEKPKTSKIKTKKKTGKNEFYRRQTFDLFTKEPKYEYINPKTGEIIESFDPNLCAKLNSEIEKLNIKNKVRHRRSGTNKNGEKIKINRSPDFSKIKFKF